MATYDGFGRVTETSTNGNKVDTTYDALGRVANTTNPYVSNSDAAMARSIPTTRSEE
jgi:YD repeat-containing protein